MIRDTAMRDGKWYTGDDVSSITSDRLPSGKESKVFMSNDGRHVIKIVDYSIYSATPTDFQRDRISLFNMLFPETAYELLGYTENADGKLCFVLRQPYINGTILGHYWSKSKGNVNYSDLEPMLEKWMLDNYGMHKCMVLTLSRMTGFESKTYISRMLRLTRTAGCLSLMPYHH